MKHLKLKVNSSFKDHIWSADLDLQLISKYNEGIRLSLCVIDSFIKYSWVLSLKDKIGITSTNTSQNVLGNSNRKQRIYK